MKITGNSWITDEMKYEFNILNKEMCQILLWNRLVFIVVVGCYHKFVLLSHIKWLCRETTEQTYNIMSNITFLCFLTCFDQLSFVRWLKVILMFPYARFIFGNVIMINLSLNRRKAAKQELQIKASRFLVCLNSCIVVNPRTKQLNRHKHIKRVEINSF